MQSPVLINDHGVFNGLSMSGLRLRVFMNYELPFVTLVAGCEASHADTRWPTPMPRECLEGLALDFLHEMATALNFTYVIYFPKVLPHLTQALGWSSS